MGSEGEKDVFVNSVCMCVVAPPILPIHSPFIHSPYSTGQMFAESIAKGIPKLSYCEWNKGMIHTCYVPKRN